MQQKKSFCFCPLLIANHCCDLTIVHQSMKNPQPLFIHMSEKAFIVSSHQRVKKTFHGKLQREPIESKFFSGLKAFTLASLFFLHIILMSTSRGFLWLCAVESATADDKRIFLRADITLFRN